MKRLYSFNTELAAKRLETLKDAFPKIARVAFLYNPGNRRTSRR